MADRARPNFHNILRQSQQAWRNAPRGNISRPQEIPKIASFLDKSAKQVFGEYLDPGRPLPIVAWSVLRDEPRAKADRPKITCRYPAEIQTRREAYLVGIRQLNEWGTDFAAQHWLSSAANPILKSIGGIYAKTCIQVNQKTIYSEAYELMENIRLASGNCSGFNTAVLTALFRHNFSLLNGFIAKSKIAEGCGTLDELALYLGKTALQKNDVRGWRNISSVFADRLSPGVLKERILFSLLSGGQWSQPGVIEIIVAQPVSIAAMGSFATTALTNPLFGAKIGIASGIMSGAPLCFNLIHETVHEYQTDGKFAGFVPISISC